MSESFGLAMIGLGVLIAVYMAWNIGANDVANAMGTSVGSGALTMRQAIIVAAIFEFGGACFLGSDVSDTIRKDIIGVENFAPEPEVLIFGMLAALFAAALWLHLATAFGMPVSTTHSIVGAVAGVGLAYGGFTEGIHWDVMFSIARSWFISPLFGGVLAFLMFWGIRRTILDRPDPRAATLVMMPYLLFAVLSTLIFAIFKKGAKNLFKGESVEAPSNVAIVVISVVTAVVLAIVLTALIRRRAARTSETSSFGFVEQTFAYLQILTACYVALAHGANDVANAMGPLAAIVDIARTGEVDMVVPVPFWILALGGAGIVVGLATFGYRVMMTIGAKIIEMSPTRGFSAEFGAATVVLICSMRGLPISTTHTLVGAVVGVGLARGMGALNQRVLYGIVASWFITVPFSAVLSIILFTILRAVVPMMFG